jgi:transposase
MIALPSGVRVWLACGHTDMRKGMDGLAMLAQQVLEEDPFICVGNNYVAALHRGLNFSAAGLVGRHII